MCRLFSGITRSLFFYLLGEENEQLFINLLVFFDDVLNRNYVTVVEIFMWCAWEAGYGTQCTEETLVR